MTGEQLATSAEEFVQVIGAFADGMFAGLYPARPDEWLCGYCEFKGVGPHPSEHAERM